MSQFYRHKIQIKYYLIFLGLVIFLKDGKTFEKIKYLLKFLTEVKF